MGKTVVITGASRGIGKAVALAFAHKDINKVTNCSDNDESLNIVINCAKNAALLEEVKNEIVSLGCNCLAVTGDISDYEFAKQLFETIIETYGSIDVLINNAGISMVGLFQDLNRNEWERIMNVNIGSIYNTCHFAIPAMLRNLQGKIINISSVWGNAGASCEVAYSATKGAVNSLTKALAKELAPSNIQVNALACGAIDTDMNSFLSEEDKNALCEEIPAGRMGTAKEVADTVLLLSEAGNYLTGQIITLDGGWI